MSDETAKAKKQPTEYVVLREVGDGQYRLVTRHHAANDLKAVDESTVDQPAGGYYAIPARSFKRREVTVENVPVRKIA